MSTLALEPLLHQALRQSCPKIHPIKSRKNLPISLNFTSKAVSFRGSFSGYGTPKNISVVACSATNTLPMTSQPTDIIHRETFNLPWIKKLEGKIYIKLSQGKDEDNWQLTVGCNLPGKWVLHWGVHYVGDVGSEWDQPPKEMRPPGSIAIKDYAVETPMRQSSSEGNSCFHEVSIDFNCNCKIAAINFVLKVVLFTATACVFIHKCYNYILFYFMVQFAQDEETGSWYQHKGRDFVLPLVDHLHDNDKVLGTKKGYSSWQGGNSGQLPDIILKGKGPEPGREASSDSTLSKGLLEGFYKEQSIVKEISVCNSLFVSVKKCPETDKNLVTLETDLPGDVVVHWGVCRNNKKKWEVPAAPHPPNTEVFKRKALRTRLQTKVDGVGAKGLFTLDKDITGFPFALKYDDDTWLNNRGNDFYISLSGTQTEDIPSEDIEKKVLVESLSNSVTGNEDQSKENQEALETVTDEIINEIRSLVTDFSSDTKWKTKSKEAQETILQEIEKLAAEAYSVFRSSAPTFYEEAASESVESKLPPKISSGTGTGFEVLCQGFNWESHKSGRWYLELLEKASDLSSLGFTVIWLPPPTESVSPEGYMPKDLYNLNSRYGTVEELQNVIKTFHKSGIKVLGDVVLNHRCAHSKNQNGIWNIFGGRLNWDDRAVVADDPHFQVLERCEYWRLSDPKGKPPGVVGWWPSRAVTFIENHDTGSTQVRYTLISYLLYLLAISLCIYVHSIFMQA
ncbi:Alpha-amylase 3 chloroplastic [Bienertia sinuspersici]